MNEKMIRKYAKMLATVGINVQPNQKVLVEACVEGYAFANVFAQECYKAGAGEVIINYLDQGFLKTKAQYQSADEVKMIKPWQYEMIQSALDEGACWIRLEGVNPKQMEEATEAQANAIFSFIDNTRNIMRKATREKRCQWCIAMVPTYEWAELLFPELNREDALNQLWETLLKLCYITEDNDIAEVWKKKNEVKHAQGKKLDALNLKALHYTASNGTDLTVELTKFSKFSFDRPKDALVFNANMPTEEIATSPYKYGTEGVVYASRPLILGGKKVENFGFRFEKGKVVEVIAEAGKEMLESLVNTDEGAAYLGEAALVEYSSPISQSGLVYYTTLIDENASCHLALGRALGVPSGAEELMNDSTIHIDFMMGTADMSIDGLTEEGTWVPVFRNGDFVI
ncbi:MAG: aminopeptidase [Erysipelotrichaceae bacterium]|nr:aminopeptidase [Erysipelotrichaceae bacterium]